TPVLVFNPSPWPRNEEVKVEIGDIDVQECLLLDASGTLVPGRVVGARLVSENILQGVKHLHKKVLIFQAQVPPLGLKTYTVLPRTGLKNTSSLFVSPRVLENEFYRVEALPNGTIKLTDKESGDVFENLGFFEDAGDAGDEYNYSPPLHQEVWTSLEAKAQVRVAEDLPWRGTLRVDLALLLPKGLSEDRSARSPERVLCPATVFVSLQQGIKRVDIAVEVENNAGDHRLRLGFPTGLKNAVSYVEDAFWVLRRLPTEVDERDWIETPSKTRPQRSFVAVERAGKGFAVINRGLPEYEVTEDGTIFITLLRGVGWLSRDDLRTWRGHAGPPYPTPEAQCLGRHRFELALVTFRGTWEESNLLEVAEAFRAPLVGVELGEGGKPLLPPEMSFLCLTPRKLVVSAVKVAEDGEGLVVRVYNPTSHTIFGQIHLFAAPSRAEWTRLDETTQASVPPQNRIHFPLKSGEIRTLKMRFPRLFDSPSD
ncbi:MAG: glycoside hydrolase family 38 C-terminal domain-containing protein, partial [Candidatus Bipolaricaulaceae bacterium]